MGTEPTPESYRSLQRTLQADLLVYQIMFDEVIFREKFFSSLSCIVLTQVVNLVPFQYAPAGGLVPSQQPVFQTVPLL
jgi:hypothetical protein